MFTTNPSHRHHAKRPVASVLPHCSGIYRDILPVWSWQLGVMFVLHGWHPIPAATEPEPLLSSLITCSLGMDGWIERGWRRGILDVREKPGMGCRAHFCNSSPWSWHRLHVAHSSMFPSFVHHLSSLLFFLLCDVLSFPFCICLYHNNILAEEYTDLN